LLIETRCDFVDLLFAMFFSFQVLFN